ncbi:lipase member I-like [Daphnia carinata]|uniref:lipase member I-like n=1 Tax=Daphnia carinata TaxID=120202 RepID=UPI002580DD92|nr:lipase member I-like [Daphnia carinata]XP_059351095.1 lipase member I-like [Daphnia carinata]XP_059351096.1 lipase member I-like [Daphnia carinata]
MTMKLLIVFGVAWLSHLVTPVQMKRQAVFSVKDEERLSRWQEPVLSFIKKLYRGRGRSMASTSSRNTIDALCHFNLWTRKNPYVQETLLTDDVALLSQSNFNASNPTRMFIHGWNMNGHSHTLLINLKNEFLANEDCNFIAVDWETLANTGSYFSSASSTQPIGVATGDFINFLITQGLNVNQLHIIGFSLGAHIAGKAGNHASEHIRQITGLDPAYPGFSISNTDARLDVTDALFVDIIHSNSANLFEGGLSFPTSIGHVDFWPNGGIVQPGCSESAVCSHSRALLYFIESINGKTPFTSTKCWSHADWKTGLCNNNTQTEMGLPVSTLANGNYYLDTNGEAPFALG